MERVGDSLLISNIQQFEDAVFMLRWIAFEQLKNSAGQVPNPKLVRLLNEIDADLRNRMDPKEIQAKYWFETGELWHAHGAIRGSLRALPYEFSKWRVESQSYALSSAELDHASMLDAPLSSMSFPHASFALEVADPIPDRFGNPFRVLLVSITRPDFAVNGNFMMSLTTVSDTVSAIHTTPVGQLRPNDLVRSIDINLMESSMSPDDLFLALKEKFAPWPWLMKDVGAFWLVWLSCLQLLVKKLDAAKLQFVPQFNPSVPPAHFPHQQPLPPLPMQTPSTPFQVVEESFEQNTPKQPSNQLGGHHQGREQRPTYRKPHLRRKRGQGHDPNGELIEVSGYQTKKEMLAPGVPLIGSRTLLN